MIDSKKVYSTLETAFADAKQQISDAMPQGERCDVHLFIFGAQYKWFAVQIQLSTGYGSDEIKVEGRDFQEVVEEFIRRKRWKRRQETPIRGARIEIQF
jgi:hypothetical protein